MTTTTTKERRVTWREQGAPGCSKCRYRGCRACLEKLKIEPIESAAALALTTAPEPPRCPLIVKSENPVDDVTDAVGTISDSVASLPVPVGSKSSSETTVAAPPKKKRRKNKNKEPTQEEMDASNEIDRLLEELNKDYSDPFFPPPLDEHGTLPEVKKKWGSETLLELLKTKMCCDCKKKLGM
jgi:hypothetical protein